MVVIIDLIVVAVLINLLFKVLKKRQKIMIQPNTERRWVHWPRVELPYRGGGITSCLSIKTLTTWDILSYVHVYRKRLSSGVQ